MPLPVNNPWNEIAVQVTLADISTESSAFAPAVIRGPIVRAYPSGRLNLWR